MGVSITGDSELISLAVVDYFSGAVLINKLVFPKVRMLHYNSPFSGIRFYDLERARGAGKCFRGRDDARAALYSFIGPETIIVGHALHQDFTSMRLIHTNVVDTLILEQSIVERCRIDTVNLGLREKEEVGNEDGGVPVNGAEPKYKKRKSGSFTLKALVQDRLGREIQVGSHNALEDAIATRDLCHWYMLNVVGSLLPVGSIEGNPQYGDVVKGLVVNKEETTCMNETDE
jgi:RNA exonuclease 1